MSIGSKAKREAKRKKEISLRHKIKWVGALTRICNWPGGCDKPSHEFMRCPDHRLKGSLSGALSVLVKNGQAERVGRGWYKAIGNCRCGHTWDEHDDHGGWREWNKNKDERLPHPCLKCGCDAFQMKTPVWDGEIELPN